MRALGLMSGTSMDGVDAAVLETDGEAIAGFGPSGFRAYAPEERAMLRASLGRWPGDAGLEEVEAGVRAAHAAAAVGFEDIDLVGFHGQTLAHEPRGRGTHQLGRGDLLARDVGVPVVWDFRTADVASGGEGAPLVPFFHFACARWIGAEAPVAFLNLGGVGNVTWVDPRAAGPEAAGALVAFDTGPGNALIDDFLGLRLGRDFDADGAVAAAGRVDEAVLAGLAAHPYLARTPPKSLDRQDFHCISRSGGRAFDRGRRGDAGGADGGLRRGGGAAFSRAGDAVAGLRRRAAEPDGDGDAGGAEQRAGGSGGGGRARRRHAGGAGLRLPGGAGAARAADLGAGDDGGAAAGFGGADQPAGPGR